jgi:hypothetical protein
MLKINVIINENTYLLPDSFNEKKIPTLYIIRLGIQHIFKPVIKTYPDHSFSVTWNEDTYDMEFFSDTVPHSEIVDALNSNHGKLF